MNMTRAGYIFIATSSVLGMGAATAPALAQNVNLVTSGSFTANDYSSDYAKCGTGPYVCASSPAGNSYLARNASDVNSSFYGLTDHTGDGGYLLVVDPSGAGSFFVATFAVAANSNYVLSFVASQLNFGSSIRASINGADAGTLFAPDTGWTSFSANYNSGSATSVTLRLDAGNYSQSYNDFAVDDVRFTGPAPIPTATAVPEPATWAMLLVGFGAVGAASRRRARARTVHA